MNLSLTKLEAIKFLGLDEKLFENYFRNACEFGCLERLNVEVGFILIKNSSGNGLMIFIGERLN